MRAYVALGANLGAADETLAWAVAELARTPGIRVLRVSRLYATLPWGDTDQPEFRNAAVALEVSFPAPTDPAAAALGTLAQLKGVERAAGRRPGRRWGPRELDLDLIVFGRHWIRVERSPDARSIEAVSDPVRAARLLEVPHRDAGERLFVLAPLADVAPGLVPPGWTVSVETRRRAVAASEPPDAVRPIGVWVARRGRWAPIASGDRG